MDKVRALIPSYADFPSKGKSDPIADNSQGVIFRDVHPIFQDHEAREILINHFVERYKNKGITAVVGLESRGYYVGIPLVH